MERKNLNKWVMLLSIVSATLIITSSMGVALEVNIIREESVEADIIREEALEERIEPEPVFSADAGRIVLDESAEEVEELSGEAIIVEKIEDPDMGTTDEGSPDDISGDVDSEPIRLEIDDPATGSTGMDDTSDISSDTSGDISNEPDDDGGSDPPEGMDLWLVFNSDIISDDPDEGSDEISSDDNLNIIGENGGDLSGSLLGSPIVEVDEIFYSACDRTIDRESYIGSLLEYNIVGYVTVDVISGSENLNGAPYFTRIDAADEALLTIASLIVMATARIASKIKDFINNIDSSVIIAIALTSGMLTALAAAVTTGTLIFSLAMILDILTDFPILNGLLQIVAQKIEDIIVRPITKVFEKLLPILKQLWIDDGAAVTLLLGLADFFIPSFFTDRSVPHAIIMYLRGETIGAIRAYLVSCGLSEAQANAKIAQLNNLKAEFNNLRANTIGKFALFMSGGNSIVSLCNLHIEIADCCQSGADEYAAILNVKAHSGKVEFDTKKIGVIYDNTMCPSFWVVEQSTILNGMPAAGSTQSSSSTTGNTMSGTTTTGTTGL